MSRCKNCGLSCKEPPLCEACWAEYEELKGIMEEHEKNPVRKFISNVPPKEGKQ